MTKKADNGAVRIESIDDLNAGNVWGADVYQIAKLWEKQTIEESFEKSEEKLLNLLRVAFEVVHYNPDDNRENEMYGGESEWVQLHSVIDSSKKIAIRPKVISRIGDLNAQNIKSISAATLLELIDRNFGGGWDALPSNLKDVIESAFDISTSQLPTSRLHLPGGSLERKIKAGYDVLEISRGTWTEAVFARKKELIDESLYNGSDASYDDGDLIVDDDYDSDDNDAGDDTFYSSFADGPQGSEDDEETEGLSIKRGEDLDCD